MDATEAWRKDTDKKKFVGSVFFYLKKAFDCVNHQILLAKLPFYGFTTLVLEWFRSYLSGRVQKVCVGNSSSQWGNITTGVPQGSILGPLLFSLFVNDIPASVSNCVCRLYADDTILYTSGDSISDLNQLL